MSIPSTTAYYAPRGFAPLFGVVDTTGPLDALCDAYGAEHITVADELGEWLDTEPAPDDVAVEYARRCMDPGVDIATLSTEAVEALTRAEAVARLRQVYSGVLQGVLAEAADELRARTVQRVKSAFDRDVRALAAAGEKLDPHEPLNKERAFDRDAAGAWRAAVEILGRLAAAAGIYPSRSAEEVPRALDAVLAVVDLPETEPYPVRRDMGGMWTPDSANIPTPTRTVHTLAVKLDKDTDATLIQIARGKFNGVTLSLATPEQFAQRVERAVTAFTYRKTE